MKTSKAFHNRFEELYDHILILQMKDGTELEGAFTDEFYEDASILISPQGNEVHIVKIEDIASLRLSPKDS